MRVLEIFENKLRYKNYSKNTIKVYKQTLHQYFKETECKDPYRISTKEIVNYLESKSFTSVAQQNQFIGCLKLFARKRITEEVQKTKDSIDAREKEMFNKMQESLCYNQ